MSGVTIYHNPNCGTSRNTLALLREKGVEPTVVEYVKAGWTKDQLQDLLTLGHTHAECPCAASAVDVFVIGVVPDTTLVVRREAERRQDGPSGSPFRPPIV